jgi:hypothetical protein
MSTEITSEEFEYKGYNFQRMLKDALWYVCFDNKIVQWGRDREDLKCWVDNEIKKDNKPKSGTCPTCGNIIGLDTFNEGDDGSCSECFHNFIIKDGKIEEL